MANMLGRLQLVSIFSPTPSLSRNLKRLSQAFTPCFTLILYDYLVTNYDFLKLYLKVNKSMSF